MNRYSLYCTREQTSKAIELGAPINKRYNRYEDFDECILDNPTVEQMIGWLEEQEVYFEIEKYSRNYTCAFAHGTEYIKFTNGSRKEATLAAIDTALDYLINNRK